MTVLFSVKLGVIEDHSNRTRLAKLLRFKTSKDGGENWSSLEEYVERMKEGQEKIYFCAGTSMDDVKNSMFTEALIKKGYEVVYLTEPVDEYTIQGKFETIIICTTFYIHFRFPTVVRQKS